MDEEINQCPNDSLDCADEGPEYEHSQGAMRLVCACGVAGPWADDFDEAAAAWNDMVSLADYGKAMDAINRLTRERNKASGLHRKKHEELEMALFRFHTELVQARKERDVFERAAVQSQNNARDVANKIRILAAVVHPDNNLTYIEVARLRDWAEQLHGGYE